MLLDPRTFLPGYQLDVDGEDLREIGAESRGDVMDFAIVTIPEDPARMTANLQGPVVINRRTRVGRQCIARDLSAAVRHNIMIGDKIEISIVSIRGNQVKLGIQAPREVKVYRQEVYQPSRKRTSRLPRFSRSCR